MNPYRPAPPGVVEVGGLLREPVEVFTRKDLVEKLLSDVSPVRCHNFVVSARVTGLPPGRGLALAMGGRVAGRAPAFGVHLYDADTRAYHKVGPGDRYAGRSTCSAPAALCALITMGNKCLHTTGVPVVVSGLAVSNIQATLRVLADGLSLNMLVLGKLSATPPPAPSATTSSGYPTLVGMRPAALCASSTVRAASS